MHPHPPEASSLPISIETQPDDVSCGATCLHAVYRYWGDALPLEEIVPAVPSLPGGGTLAVHLANHALERGYAATIHTYNLHLFDPTWFTEPGVDVADRLQRQLDCKGGDVLAARTEGYLRFLELGGTLRYADLDAALLRRPLRRGLPLITGLCATYLYRTAREWGPNDDYDDLRGAPSGHFVVLTGYRTVERRVEIADPLREPLLPGRHYTECIERVIGAIMLGVLTHDANLLTITPGPGRDRRP